jgi:sarcosine oxidase subunit beta
MLSHLPELLDVNVDIEFTQNGYLMPAYSEKMAEQFKQNLLLQNSLEIPARWVTPEESLEIVPFLNTKGMLGATYCAEDGHCNPFKVTEAYAQAARNLNVEIYTDTEVKGIVTKKWQDYRCPHYSGGYSDRYSCECGRRICKDGGTYGWH